MDELLVDPIGLAWLAKTYQITPIVRMPVQSQIGGRRLTEVIDGYRIETYQESMRPADTPAAHLQFHLRHEVLHAFLFESGLSETAGFSGCWATNEEMVDWFAIQSPKIFEVFSELDLI